MHKTAKRWYFVTKIYRTRPNFTKQLQISHKRRKNKQFSKNFLLSCNFSTPDHFLSVSVSFNQPKRYFVSLTSIFKVIYLTYLYIFVLSNTMLMFIVDFLKNITDFYCHSVRGCVSVYCQEISCGRRQSGIFFQIILNKHKD